MNRDSTLHPHTDAVSQAESAVALIQAVRVTKGNTKLVAKEALERYLGDLRRREDWYSKHSASAEAKEQTIAHWKSLYESATAQLAASSRVQRAQEVRIRELSNQNPSAPQPKQSPPVQAGNLPQVERSVQCDSLATVNKATATSHTEPLERVLQHPMIPELIFRWMKATADILLAEQTSFSALVAERNSFHLLSQLRETSISLSMLKLQLQAEAGNVAAAELRLSVEKETTSALREELRELHEELRKVSEERDFFKMEGAHRNRSNLPLASPLGVEISCQTDHVGSDQALQESIHETMRFLDTLRFSLLKVEEGSGEVLGRGDSASKAALFDADMELRKENERLRSDLLKLVHVVRVQGDALSKLQRRIPERSEKWTQLNADFSPLPFIRPSVFSAQPTPSASLAVQTDAVKSDSGQVVSEFQRKAQDRLDSVKGYLIVLEKALDTSRNAALRQGLVEEIHLLHSEVLQQSSQGGPPFSMY